MEPQGEARGAATGCFPFLDLDSNDTGMLTWEMYQRCAYGCPDYLKQTFGDYKWNSWGLEKRLSGWSAYRGKMRSSIQIPAPMEMPFTHMNLHLYTQLSPHKCEHTHTHMHLHIHVSSHAYTLHRHTKELIRTKKIPNFSSPGHYPLSITALSPHLRSLSPRLSLLQFSFSL